MSINELLSEARGQQVSTRREPRTMIVREAEYSAWPRASKTQRPCEAFTRDTSPSGLGLSSRNPEEPGQLLRVVVRDARGRADLDALARVVWCVPQARGRFRMGLRLLEGGIAID